MAHDGSGPHSRMILTVLSPNGQTSFQSMGFTIPWKQLVSVETLVDQAQEVGWKTATVVPFPQLYRRYCPNRPVLDLSGHVILTLAK